jgi:hypothetical protein
MGRFKRGEDDEGQLKTFVAGYYKYLRVYSVGTGRYLPPKVWALGTIGSLHHSGHTIPYLHSSQ